MDVYDARSLVLDLATYVRSTYTMYVLCTYIVLRRYVY